MLDCDRRILPSSSCAPYDNVIQETRCKLNGIEDSIATTLFYFGDLTRAGGDSASTKDNYNVYEK